MAHTNELSDAIEAGWTLPANWYVDDDIFALERERIPGHVPAAAILRFPYAAAKSPEL